MEVFGQLMVSKKVWFNNMLTALVPVAVSGDAGSLIDCYLQKHNNREECYSKGLQVSLQREIIDTLDNSHLKSMKSLWFHRIMQQIITGLGIPVVFAIIPQRTSFVEVHFTCIIWWCSNRLCSKLSKLLNVWQKRWQQIIIM